MFQRNFGRLKTEGGVESHRRPVYVPCLIVAFFFRTTATWEKQQLAIPHSGPMGMGDQTLIELAQYRVATIAETTWW
jgi:hypothetical protein